MLLFNAQKLHMYRTDVLGSSQSTIANTAVRYQIRANKCKHVIAKHLQNCPWYQALFNKDNITRIQKQASQHKKSNLISDCLKTYYYIITLI